MLGNTGKQPRRIVAYVRVSRVMGREGDGYISPAVQEESIRRWAQYAGADVVAVLVDEDVSGGTAALDRPGMREAFAMIEDGAADGLAVAKLNRFSRSTLSALRDLERLEQLGGGFVSVEEELDTGTPTGRFALTMLLAVATLERDSIVAGWKVAKSRAIDRGAKVSRTPFGYRRREDGGLDPDPDEAPIVREAFGRAARHDVDAAVEYLQLEAPVRTWTRYTVARLLANRTYLGESHYGSLVNVDAFERLVDRATFEAAQPVKGARKRKPPAAYPLAGGLARCAACGENLVGGRGGRGKDGRGLRVYRCRASLAGWKGERCTSPTNVTADKLEEYVVRIVGEALEAAGAPVVEVGEESLDVTAAEERLVGLEDELQAFAADVTARTILGDGYHAALQARVDAVAQARDELVEIVRAQAAGEIIAVDRGQLEALDGDDLRDVLCGGLEAIVVARGRGDLGGRVEIVPKGHAKAA